jgi:hypothetical protein
MEIGHPEFDIHHSHPMQTPIPENQRLTRPWARKTLWVAGALFLGLFAWAWAWADTYSVTLDPLAITAYPAIPLSLDIQENGKPVQNLTARHFQISENGKQNNGPLVVLQPHAPNAKMDLYILLDRSGNAQKYESLVKANLKGLFRAEMSQGIDLRIFINSFGNGDTAMQTNLVPVHPADFESFVDNLAFDDLPTTPFVAGYGLSRLYSFAYGSPRPDADKVALVLTATPFADESQTGKSFSDVANHLGENGFIVLSAGLPLKSLASPRTENSEDSSLTHALQGGYLGSLSTDLTLIPTLMAHRKRDRYSLLYFSTLPPDQAAGSKTDLSIDDSPALSFALPAMGSTSPTITHTPPSESLTGDPLTLTVQASPNQRLVNAVEVRFFDSSLAEKSLILPKDPSTSTDSLIAFTGSIPADEMPTDTVLYQVAAHTPYETLETATPTFVVPVLQFDKGITLTATEVNGTEILWRWSGPTVSLGTQFELYGGDKLIVKTDQLNTSIPVTECGRYQIVKLRVLVRPGADHPRAGQWSLFSLPAEHYIGPTDPISESAGIGTLMQCLNPEKATSAQYVTENETIYRPNALLNLDKTLYYAATAYDRSIRNDILLSHFGLLFSILNMVSPSELAQYGNADVSIPRSLVYKTITGINQSADFGAQFQKAQDTLAQRIFGDTTL